MASQEQLRLLEDVNINRYFMVANLTILAYDLFLTFDDEVQLVYPSRLSIVKVVFYMNRYLPFVAVIGQMCVLIYDDSSSLHACKATFQTFCGITLANYAVAELILYLRAYAVWREHRRVLCIIAMAYSGFFVFCVYTTLKAILHATVPYFERTILKSGCMLIINGESEWSVYLVLIMSEFFALIMLVIKASKMDYSARMEQILDDGVAYFILMLVTSTGTAFVLRLAPKEFSNLITVTQATIHSIICSHLLLRIRKGYHQERVQHLILLSSRSYDNVNLAVLRGLPVPSRR